MELLRERERERENMFVKNPIQGGGTRAASTVPPGPSERARRHQLRAFLGLSGEPDENRAVLIPRFPLSAGATAPVQCSAAQPRNRKKRSAAAATRVGWPHHTVRAVQHHHAMHVPQAD
jgi:hypothetical protein